MSTQTQEHYERGEAYSSLVGMSIISGLLIVALIVPLFITSSNSLGPMITVMIQQWLSVIPATIVVVFLHGLKSHYDKSRPIRLVSRVGIPLIINILAACSMFFMASLLPLFCMIIPMAVLGLLIYWLTK